jgi:DNA-binding protein WhiA
VDTRPPAGPPPGGSFTERVRQELSRTPLGRDPDRRAELAAVLRLAGSLHLHGGDTSDRRLSLEVVTTSGAVARRTFALLQALHDARPELRMRAPGGVQRRTTYAVAVVSGARRLGRQVGLLDGEGRPLAGLPGDLLPDRAAVVAHLRGAVLAAGSVSAPGRPPHLEVATGSGSQAEALAALARSLTAGTVTAVTGERPRLVVKSGATIAELLAATGAATAAAAWTEHRRRRDLRNRANRLANADGANLRRAVEAAAAQTRAVEAVIERVGWGALDPDLRDVALVRLANPSASLSELGELCDPPLGKSSVHRRLQRLLALTEGETSD